MKLDTHKAYQRALAVARDLGWTLTEENFEEGLILAVASTRLLGLKDDVSIRIRKRAAADEVEIDIRAASRIGRGDLGANASRIRRFMDRMLRPDL